MSPRHFSKAMQSKTYKDPIADKIKPGMTLWFAFTTVTGISNMAQKLFVFTPHEITNYPVNNKDQGDQSASADK